MREIQLENIKKTYRKKTALHIPTLKVQGGMIGLLGPNGAGKTTLLRVLAGFIKPSKGTVLVAGYDMQTSQGKRQLRQQLGYVPQHVAVYPAFATAEFVDYIAQLKGMNDTRQRRIAVERSLAYVGLEAQAQQKTRTLSGGMLRRLAIAQAIVNDPAVLIVDEPTAGLDPEERMRFRHLLSGLSGDRLVILSTHIVEDIAQTCNQVIILNQAIVYAGAVKPLIETLRAREVVWEIQTARPLHEKDLTVISSIATDHGFAYRVVGAYHAAYNPQPAEIVGLEEAYVWSMQQHKQTYQRVGS